MFFVINIASIFFEVELTGMLQGVPVNFLFERQGCREGVWWETVCLEGHQFYEMYFIDAGANDLV